MGVQVSDDGKFNGHRFVSGVIVYARACPESEWILGEIKELQNKGPMAYTA